MSFKVRKIFIENSDKFHVILNNRIYYLRVLIFKGSNSYRCEINGGESVSNDIWHILRKSKKYPSFEDCLLSFNSSSLNGLSHDAVDYDKIVNRLNFDMRNI